MKTHLVPAYHWAELSSGNKAGRIFFCRKSMMFVKCGAKKKEKSVGRAGCGLEGKIDSDSEEPLERSGIIGYFLETSKNSK